MARVQLQPVSGGHAVVLEQLVTLIGRKEGCDLRLNHKSVSKHHCVLVRSDGLLMLRDLGSTNGTRVNGKRVRRAVLNENDQLSIAALSFRVHFLKEEASRSAPPSEGATHMIDAQEVEKLIRKTQQPPERSGAAAPEPVVRVNALPDEFTPVADASLDG